METARRELEIIPYDHAFDVEEGRSELCHSTGYEVEINGEWWNEYEDDKGNLHYGR